MVTYIVDDRDEDIRYLCPATSVIDRDTYYQQTWTTIGNSTCSDGWFEYIFRGQAVNVMAGMSNQNTSEYSVSLDGTALENQQGTGAYQSGILADEEHFIMYATGATDLVPTFDYLTVLAGNTTHMRGRTVIVDDLSGEIEYSGNRWTSAAVAEDMFRYGRGAYQDTVHWTGAVGESLSFKFLGSSVALYAVLSAADAGNITLQYEVDGNFLAAQTIANHQHIPLPMFKLVETGNLTAGTHVLTASVTDVQNDYAIGIDFVLYNASYDTINEIPIFGTSTSSSLGSPKHSANVSAIVGGVVGGLLFIGIVMLVMFVLRRRQRQRQRSRAAAAVIGRNYNPQLDVKVVPRPITQEAYSMSTRA